MEGRRGERYSRDLNAFVLHREKPRDTAEVNEKENDVFHYIIYS